MANESRDNSLKTSLIASLLAFSVTGCDQVIQRLSNKAPNNPSITLPETAKEPLQEHEKQTEIPAKMAEREDNKKPAEHTKSREQALSSEKTRTQRDEYKKREGINQQVEAVGVDSKGKSAIQKKKKVDANPSEVDEAGAGTVRRGNVSREY